MLLSDRLDVAVDDIDDCIRLARQCRLTALKQQLETRKNDVQIFGEDIPLPVCLFVCLFVCPLVRLSVYFLRVYLCDRLFLGFSV